MAGSKENYKFDLGVKRLRRNFLFFFFLGVSKVQFQAFITV